jgi:hypothetical protein
MNPGTHYYLSTAGWAVGVFFTTADTNHNASTEIRTHVVRSAAVMTWFYPLDYLDPPITAMGGGVPISFYQFKYQYLVITMTHLISLNHCCLAKNNKAWQLNNKMENVFIIFHYISNNIMSIFKYFFIFIPFFSEVVISPAFTLLIILMSVSLKPRDRSSEIMELRSSWKCVICFMRVLPSNV